MNEQITIFYNKDKYNKNDYIVKRVLTQESENYTIISYKDIWEKLRKTPEYNEDGNYNFRDFVDALYKHSLDSVPMVKYIEMRDQFITRINNA